MGIAARIAEWFTTDRSPQCGDPRCEDSHPQRISNRAVRVEQQPYAERCRCIVGQGNAWTCPMSLCPEHGEHAPETEEQQEYREAAERVPDEVGGIVQWEQPGEMAAPIPHVGDELRALESSAGLEDFEQQAQASVDAVQQAQGSPAQRWEQAPEREQETRWTDLEGSEWRMWAEGGMVKVESDQGRFQAQFSPEQADAWWAGMPGALNAAETQADEMARSVGYRPRGADTE